MPRFRLKLTAVLTFVPVMVAAAIAWGGAPAMADFPPPPSPLTPVAHVPQPVIGALGGFSFSRKLRQRITRTQANSSRIGCSCRLFDP
jgi:hypothetical protein